MFAIIFYYCTYIEKLKLILFGGNLNNEFKYKMCEIYPEYLPNEEKFDELWSIDDESWGFYHYSTELKKTPIYGNNDFYYYQYYDVNTVSNKYGEKYRDYVFNAKFKLVYKNYEGLLSIDDVPLRGHIQNHFVHFKLIENNDQYVIFKYINESKFEPAIGNLLNHSDQQYFYERNKILLSDIVIRLDKINQEYIKTISDEMKEFNNLINNEYIEGIKSRQEILSNIKHYDGDY